MQIQKNLILIAVFVFSISLASAIGILGPVPGSLQLMPGESADFFFGIYAPPADISCTYHVSGDFPIQVAFSREQVTVKADKEAYIYATATVPKDTAYKEYSGNLCVECIPVATEGGGSGVKFIPCTYMKVNVVEQRTMENTRVKEEKKFPWWIWLLIALIVIILIIIFYIVYKKWLKKY